jgi:hypothetical protein
MCLTHRNEAVIRLKFELAAVSPAALGQVVAFMAIAPCSPELGEGPLVRRVRWSRTGFASTGPAAIACTQEELGSMR